MSEEFKSIAYTQKDIQNLERQFTTKFLRVLRNHEKRLKRIEKNLGIQASPYEIMDSELSETTDQSKGNT